MTKHTTRPSRMAGSAALLCALLTGCGGGSVADKPVGPVTPVDTTKPPGTVQRATLAVTVSIDVADASLATTAGVTQGGIIVRIQRVGSTEAARSAVTGADGVARFDQLLEGVYQVSADRPLTSAEMARLPAEDRDASIFAGGTQIIVAPPQGQTSVQLVASRRGSLLISELFVYRSPGAPDFYGFGTYFEVYNNADTTAFLDGMLFFMTMPQMHRGFSNVGGCPGTVAKRTDPDGVWAQPIWAFPGTGRDYPIRPGEARVVAMDAINHAAASPTTDQLDLSSAHFEQIGTDADINNPFVPDMIRVRGSTGILGRGHPIDAARSYGLALASARDRLVAGDIAGADLVRVPADALLDVVGLDYSPSIWARLVALGATSEACLPWLTPSFERAPAALGNTEYRMAIARRSLGRTADGREILQRTRTSARDFDYTFPLRRSLLK
jgi:hypothetical protein